MGREGPADAFLPFPCTQYPNGHIRYDLDKIKKDYFDSPITEWEEYCRANRLNPRQKEIPWKTFVREKRYRISWEQIRSDIETEGMALGPKLLLQQIRSVKTVPETASALLTLLQHQMSIHLDEMRHDQPLLKQAREQRTVVNPMDLHFSLTPFASSAMAAALKTTSELLYKSLGLEEAQKRTPQKWAEVIDAEVGAVDGTAEMMKIDQTNPITISLKGGGEMREIMLEAMNKWMDKPGEVEALVAQLPPEHEQVKQAKAPFRTELEEEKQKNDPW